MSTTNSDSESKELQISGEEDDRTENGYSHEENGYSHEENGYSHEENEYSHEENGYSHEENGNLNGNGTSASWRALGRALKSPAPSTLAFPISRVRRLVKSESGGQWVGVEAGFLVAKATELFLEKMAEDAFDRMQDNRQESILYPHLSSHVASSERLEFLSDFVPMKIPALTALSNASMTNK